MIIGIVVAAVVVVLVITIVTVYMMKRRRQKAREAGPTVVMPMGEPAPARSPSGNTALENPMYGYVLLYLFI